MLLGNGYATLGPVPATYIGGATGVTYPGNLRTLYGRGERMTQASAFGSLASQPDGTNHPTAWLMPRKAGRVSARAAQASLVATGAGLRGLPAEGAATASLTWAQPVIYPLDDASPLRTALALLSIVTNAPAGGLIVSGAGSTALSLSAVADMLAVLQGAGAASLALALAGLLGAEANLSAAAGLSLAPTAATVYPLDDTPPTRSATANMTVGGSLLPYAIGQLAGSTLETTDLTPESIAAAVWAATAAAHNLADSMGEKLNAAGTAGDPWTGSIEGGLTAKEALRLLLAAVGGRASGGGTGEIHVRDLANTKDRIVMTVDAQGNRSAVTLDGS